MSDLTVTPFGAGGHTVAVDGHEYQVLPNDAMGWGIYTGPNLDLVPAAEGGFAIGFGSADDAIAAIRDTHDGAVDEA